MEIAKMIKATHILKERGVEGAIEASFLIDKRTVIAALLTLTDEEPEALEKRFAEAGLDSAADFCPIDGRAVIYKKDVGLVGALSIQPGGKVVEVPIAGLQVRMWLPGSEEMFFLFAGKPPYTELKRLMLVEHHKATTQLLNKLKTQNTK